MQILSALKPFIPRFHAFLGEDRNYNVGLDFVDDMGLSDRHNVAVRYTRNSEKKALEHGTRQEDGSWLYVCPSNGAHHTCSKEKADLFYQEAAARAEVAKNMADKMDMEAQDTEVVDTEPVEA